MTERKNGKIMLIDDDNSLHVLMRHLFEDAGYSFCEAYDGPTGIEIISKERPDLLLLDVMLPGMNGFEICKKIREQGRRILILFLSAKGDIVDKSIGFQAGGDDYIVKPFNNEELLLRVEAFLRRRRNDLKYTKPVNLEGGVTIKDLTINFNRYEVTVRDKPVVLTAKEFEVLSLLASNPGQVFSREQIYEHLWGRDGEADVNSITVFIRRIREKIEVNPSAPEYLLTVWRIGYKMTDGKD